MKINSNIILTLLISILAFMPSCVQSPDDTLEPSPMPDPEPEPPVEEVEPRLISMIKESNDDWVYTMYFGYDDLGRIDRIIYEDYDDYYGYYYELSEIDYVSDDYIKVKFYENYNEPSCYLEYEEYLFLNEEGYLESAYGVEYTYNNNGYLVRSDREHYYGEIETYDIRWRNGNIISIVEDSLYGIANNVIQSNNKNLNMVNIDLSSWLITGLGISDFSDIYMLPLDIYGTKSNNYVTSVDQSYEGSNGSYSYHATYTWSYDNDGYPRLCRVSFTESQNGHICTEYDSILEISYIDETGEIEPKPAPTPEKEQLAAPVLSVSDVTTTGFTVSWSAIENAANYTVLIDGANSQTISETTVTFTGLTSGEHTVGVKAMAAAGSNYSDSAMATIKQSVGGSNDWFMQDVYTRTIPEEGIYDCNYIFVKWSGSNLKSVKYAVLDGTKSESASDDDVIAQMQFGEGDWIETINSEGFIVLSMPTTPNTKIEVAALATDANGQTILERDMVTTGDPLATVNDYVGTFTATFTKQCVWDVVDGGNSVAPEVVDCNAYTRTLTMELLDQTEYPGYVAIYGFSVLSDDIVAFGAVDAAGVLNIFNYQQCGDADADGYVPTWLGVADGGLVGTQVGYTVAPDGNGGFKAVGVTSTYQDGTPFKVEAMEVFAMHETKGIALYVEEFPFTHNAGDFTLVKSGAASARTAAGFKSFDFSNLKSYVTNVPLYL